MFIPEAERNEHALAEVCASLRAAVRRRDAGFAWCYLISARSLACPVVGPDLHGPINAAADVVQAHLQREAWPGAHRSVEAFVAAVRTAVAAARLRN